MMDFVQFILLMGKEKKYAIAEMISMEQKFSLEINARFPLCVLVILVKTVVLVVFRISMTLCRFVSDFNDVKYNWM